MRTLYKTALICGCIAMAACGKTMSEEDRERSAAEAEVAEQISSDELMDPAVAARNEAKKFISHEWKDSLELHKQILEARAAKSEYEVAGRHRDAEVFDSVFIATLRTIKPDLARQIRPDSL